MRWFAAGLVALTVYTSAAGCTPPVGPPGIDIDETFVARETMPGSLWVEGNEYALRARLWVSASTSFAYLYVHGFEIVADGRVRLLGVPDEYSPPLGVVHAVEAITLVGGDLHVAGFGVGTGGTTPTDVDLVIHADGALSGSFMYEGRIWSVEGPVEVRCRLDGGGFTPTPEWLPVQTYAGPSAIDLACGTGEFRMTP